MKRIGIGCLLFFGVFFVFAVTTFVFNSSIIGLLFSGVILAFAIYKLTNKKELNNAEIKTKNDKKVRIQYLVDEFELIVTGIYYNSERTGISRQKFIRELEEYDPVYLEKEPDNQFDKNAILVLNYDKVDLGYVKREELNIITRYLNEKYIIEACVIKKFKTNDGYGIIIDVTVREYRDG